MVWACPRGSTHLGIYVTDHEKVVDMVRLHIAANFTKIAPC